MPVYLFSVACALGCGEGTSAELGVGGFSGSTMSGVGGAEPVTQSYQLAIVDEAAPGAGAALVTFQNKTDFVLTVQLGGAIFSELTNDDPVPPPQPAVANDVLTNFRVGYCKAKGLGAPCVIVIPESIDGANELIPSHEYLAILTGADVKALHVDIMETRSTPFLTFRARRGFELLGTTAVSLNTSAGVFELDVSMPYATMFLPVEQEQLSLHAVTLSNSKLELSGEIGTQLSGSTTLWFADGPIDGASESFPLD